jgi:hypothetical protein
VSDDQQIEPGSRSELALLRRAARERWGIPDRSKTRGIEVADAMLESPDERQRVAALRFMVAAVKCDLADDRLDQLAERLAFDKAKAGFVAGKTEARDAWDAVCTTIETTADDRSGSAPESTPEPSR